MHGTLDRRIADTVAWPIYYTEHTVSRAYARYKNCFAAGAAIDQIMYFITLCGDTELRLKKIGRNREGVLMTLQHSVFNYNSMVLNVLL
jgi:hypothetical protein